MTILDSGVGLTTMSVSVAARLQAKLPDDRSLGAWTSLDNSRLPMVACCTTRKNTCPVRTSLHTNWGPAVLDPFSSAVSCLATITWWKLVVRRCLREVLTCTTVRGNARALGITPSLGESIPPSVHDCRRVTIRVDLMQRLHQPEEPDEAVERLVAHESDKT